MSTATEPARPWCLPPLEVGIVGDVSNSSIIQDWHRAKRGLGWGRELVPKMKKLFRIITIGFLGIVFLGASPRMASAGCSSKPNIFGGSDTKCTDGSKSSTRPNIFGGYDTYDGSGRKISSSKPNIFGGTDTKNSNSSNTTKTKPNIFGGKDITGSNGLKTGSTKPNIFGGYDVFDKNGRKLQSCKPNIFGGYDCRWW